MVLSTIQTVGILVGIVYYLTIMRNAQKTRELTLQAQELALKAQEQALETRQAQFFMQSYRETATTELQTLAFKILRWEWTDFADFREKYYLDPNKWGEFASFMIHMNGLGIMLEEKYIDSELLYKMDQDGAAPMWWWFKFESVIREMREQMNNPSLMKYFEFYVEEMIRLRKLNGLSSKYSIEQDRFINE